MNIWYVHPTAGGPGLGRHWRAYWLAHYWAEAGHQVTVVTAGYHHIMDSDGRDEGLHPIGGVRYWFAAVPPYESNGLARLKNMLSFGWRLRRTAKDIVAAVGKPDVVIASSPHIFAVGSVMSIARRFGAAFWLEVRDVWPESMVALKQVSRFNPMIFWAAWLERRAYRRAERVVSLLAGARPHMEARGLRPGRFLWAPNGISEADVANALNGGGAHDEDPLVARTRALTEQGVFVLVYAGAMGPPQQLEQLLDAFALLQAREVRAHLVMVGDGFSRQQLIARAQELQLRNVEIGEQIPKQAVGDLLRHCGAAVLSLRANDLWRHGLSPNKLFDYCLYAPRVIATCEEAALTGLEDLHILRTPPGDPAALAALLEDLARQPRQAPQPQAAVQALQQFRLKEVAQRILEGPVERSAG